MWIVAAGLPAQLLTQRLQRIQNAGLIGAVAVIAQEEPVAGGSWHESVTQPDIRAQGLRYARMKRHQPLPVEFGFLDIQNADIEADVGMCQHERFGDSQPACSQQTDDTPASSWPQALFGGQTLGRIEQRTQFGLSVDVRDQASVCRAEEIPRRDLRRRIRAQAKAREAAQDLNAARPGERTWSL
jgi:hypothetical protein